MSGPACGKMNKLYKTITKLYIWKRTIEALLFMIMLKWVVLKMMIGCKQFGTNCVKIVKFEVQFIISGLQITILLCMIKYNEV